MRRIVSVVAILLSLVIFSSFVYSISINDDLNLDIGIHFIRPESKYIFPSESKEHFLSVDSVNFIACIEEDSKPSAFLVCLDNICTCRKVHDETKQCDHLF